MRGSHPGSTSSCDMRSHVQSWAHGARAFFTLALLGAGASGLYAQSTNGLVTIVQETLAGTGGEVGGGSQVHLLSSIGDPYGGEVSNGLVAVMAGYPSSGATPSAPASSAQPTNGLVTLLQDSMGVVGDQVSAGTASMIVHAGQPAAGEAQDAVVAVMAGYPTEPPPVAEGARTITVTGTIDDPTASIMVNGARATISGTTFSADILLVEGVNTIAALAADPAGNSAGTSIQVTLNTQRPPKPTVWTPLAVTTATSYPLSGTKTAETSVWINGIEVVPANSATTWSITVTNLLEGDNILLIVTKNAAGNVSATTTANIIVDNLPPVITTAPPAKTNLAPFTLTGTVDDSLTTVEVNGLIASRSGQTFSVSVPLVEGANTLTITATSPNHHVATQAPVVVLGTIPAITAVSPTTGAKSAAGASMTITITATDKEHDPLSFQILLDGAVLADWTPAASSTWTPALTGRGRHVLELRTRDDFGGYASQQVQVYVTRQQVAPLAP